MSVMSVSWFFWFDIGYTEGCAESPLTSVLPGTYDRSITGGRVPEVKDLFSYVKIKGVDYEEAKGYKYMRADYTYTDGSEEEFYGWIDKVDLLSDTVDANGTRTVMCGISWHVDLWRTYISSVTLGRGTVLRRKNIAGERRAPQTVNSNFKQYTYFQSLVPVKDHLWWVIFTYVTEDSSGEITEIRQCCFPVSTTEGRIVIATLSTFSDARFAPSMAELLKGSWDEYLGLTPSRIVSAFLSPVAPVSYTKTTHEMSGTGYPAVYFNAPSGWNVSEAPSHVIQSETYGCFLGAGYVDGTGVAHNHFDTYEVTPSDDFLVTTDTNQAVVTGFSREPIGYIPYWKEVRNYDYRVVHSSVSAYIQIRFADKDATGSVLQSDKRVAAAVGLAFTVPLIPIDISSNSYSEYNYTGAREYDRAQRAEATRYDREVERVDAATNIAVGAVGTVVGGAIGGGFGALIGSGGMASGVSSLIAQGVHTGMRLEEQHNANLDSISSRYQAKLSDSLVMSGSGFDLIFNGSEIGISYIGIDEYSESTYNNNINHYGIRVCEAMSDCSSRFVEGPLMIDNLTVKTQGNAKVPIEAIDYIKARLKRGVYLVTQ